MIVVPKAAPVTLPVEAPTVATAVLLLDHVPPVGAPVRVEDPLIHAFVVPVIPVGQYRLPAI